jgi:type II secretory ATPase GspE/PulE/Tfp pilus assembly ATPase PilB-like protein
MKQQGLASLRRYLLAHGYQPMAEDARRKITMGWTTEEEVERILARHPGSPPRPYL